MGVFKAVGYPEDVGRFYRLDEYAGYCWTAHGRYPTNTPGWWGGAHPFALLDYSVVHNGEISSYDANRRFIEMFGYKCTLQTDTEVITYIADYLLRRQGLTLEEAATVIAAPFWSTIARQSRVRGAKRLTYLRTVFSSLLITGPFSIVLGFDGGLMALNDRLKLRSMVTAEKDDLVFISQARRPPSARWSRTRDNVWAPDGRRAGHRAREGGDILMAYRIYLPAEFEVIRHVRALHRAAASASSSAPTASTPTTPSDKIMLADEIQMRELPALRCALPDARAENRKNRLPSARKRELEERHHPRDLQAGRHAAACCSPPWATRRRCRSTGTGCSSTPRR